MRLPCCRKRVADYEKVEVHDKDNGVDEEQRARLARNFRGCPNVEKPWPEYNAGILSRLCFAWFNPLIQLGSSTSLELDDVWALDQGDSSKPNSEKLWRYWEDEKARAGKKGQEPWLGWPIIRLTWKRLFKASCLRFINESLSFARPLLMQQILLIVEGSPAIVAPEKAWMLGIGMVAASFLQLLLGVHYDNTINRMAFRLRCSVVGALFRKSTDLSVGAKSTYSSGQIVTMMSTDADRAQNLVSQVNYLFFTPLSFCFALYLLIWNVGPAAYAALAMIVVVIPPLMTFWTKTSQKIYKAKMKESDKRAKLITEIMNSIRIIKFMSWEDRFIGKVSDIRTQELKLMRRRQLLSAGLSSVYSSLPIAMIVVVLGLYAKLGGHLTASMAFTTITLMDMVRGPLITITSILNAVLVDGKTAVDRLSKFLNTPDMENFVVHGEPGVDKMAVEFKGVTLEHPSPQESIWDPDAKRGSLVAEVCNCLVPHCIRSGVLKCCPKICCCFSKRCSSKPIETAASQEPADTSRGPCLTNVSLAIPQGKLCCLVGRVGSGKSSLVLSLLGEIDKPAGSIHVNGRISYAAQTAAVVNDTVRNNILFGNEYNAERYSQVLKVCCLKEDLKSLPAGDASQIGEKGISLSGGQRQRIGLARACYNDADIYLLDDPLSAVDAHTGKTIFDKCINGMLKDKTVILPIHNLGFLDQADMIVALKDGEVIEQGTYSQLMTADREFAKMMTEFAAAKSIEKKLNDEEDGDSPKKKKMSPGKSPGSPDSPIAGEGQLMENEERNRGGVKSDVYFYYLRQAGCLCQLIVFAYVLQRLASVLNQWIMSRWTVFDTVIVLGYNESWTQNDLMNYFLALYATSATASMLCGNITSVVVCMVGLRTAKRLHKSLLANLMHVPTAFFDVTPTGRIVNRFTSDMSTVDQSVIYQWAALVQYALITVIGMAVVSYTTMWIFALAVPTVIIFLNMQQKYRLSARELKRLNSISRSPIFSHFGETLNNLTTVRAFGSEARLIEKNYSNNDDYGRAMLAASMCWRWLRLRLQSMANMASALVTIWICLHPNQMDAGMTAMMFAFSGQVTGYLQYLINTFTNLEIQMNSIERVKYYTEVPTEAAFDQNDAKSRSTTLSVPDQSWPSRGKIEFDWCCARYRPGLPLVIEDVTFTVEPEEKVGVVGRTGSGKSTLMQLLFRIIELHSGSIKFDGVDIANVGLRQLRTAIAILPQDPTLFTGTIRDNLDPFHEYTDDQLWEAMTRAQMGDAVKNMPQQLATPVGEGGASFSVGERQLLCLARSVLAQRKILIMDECTASVDVQTDAKIQSMIRDAFKTCTVFAIAHRLDTIIDYDRIVVLDHGQLAEYDSPANLLRNSSNGIFSSLVAESGAAQAERLKKIAFAKAAPPLVEQSSDGLSTTTEKSRPTSAPKLTDNMVGF